MLEYMFSDRLDGETHAIVCNARKMKVKWDNDLHPWHGIWVQPLPPEPVEAHKMRTFNELRAGRKRVIELAVLQRIADPNNHTPLRWATEEQWNTLLGLCVGGYAKHIIITPRGNPL